MNIHLRLERPEDYRIVEELTRAAFYDNDSHACDEHLLVHKQRSCAAFVPSLDYVAEIEGRIVGNVMYTKAKIVDDNGAEHEVLTFGPLSVLPEYQRRGVGSALMRHTIPEAKKQGWRAIVFGGHPDYYPRFGFQRAAEYGIISPGGGSNDGLMAMPLYEGALDGVCGRFYEDDVFNPPDQEELARFDATFPPREKRVHTPLSVLAGRISPSAWQAVRERITTSLHGFRGYSGREIAAWPGVSAEDARALNDTLIEYGYPPKTLPGQGGARI